jgi:hypothetical protein
MRSSSLALLCLTGCLGTDLDFESDGSSMRAIAGGDGSTVVQICAGPRGLLTCNDDESFHVAMAGAVEAAAPASGLAFGTLSATLSADRGTVTVTRDRDGATASGVVPEPFSLSGPSGQVSSATLRWTPSGQGDRMHWDALVSCPSQSSGLDGADTADDGEVTIRAGDLPGAAGCEVTVRLRRERDGSLGAGWQDGSVMMAAQQREVAFTLTP